MGSITQTVHPPGGATSLIAVSGEYPLFWFWPDMTGSHVVERLEEDIVGTMKMGDDGHDINIGSDIELRPTHTIQGGKFLTSTTGAAGTSGPILPQHISSTGGAGGQDLIIEDATDHIRISGLIHEETHGGPIHAVSYAELEPSWEDMNADELRRELKSTWERVRRLELRLADWEATK
ncbi:hypothetical protein HDU76_005756, partial [Blyttiomyces sp. JEL0837]